MDNKWVPISICILAISVLISGFIITGSIEKVGMEVYRASNTDIQIVENSDILSMPEAAVYLNISEQTLSQLVELSANDDLGIPFYKIDGSVRFSKTALTQWTIKISSYKIER